MGRLGSCDLVRQRGPTRDEVTFRGPCKLFSIIHSVRIISFLQKQDNSRFTFKQCETYFRRLLLASTSLTALFVLFTHGHQGATFNFHLLQKSSRPHRKYTLYSNITCSLLVPLSQGVSTGGMTLILHHITNILSKRVSDSSFQDKYSPLLPFYIWISTVGSKHQHLKYLI